MSGFLAVLFMIFAIALIWIPVYAGIPAFVVFLILKLCNVITWSWWFIFIPLIAWVIAGILYMFLSISSRDIL